MRKFQEYLDSRGKIDNPKVKVVADDVDMPADRTKKPPKGMGMKDGKQPYVNDDGKVSRSSGKKAFGEQGEGEVYDVTKSKKAAKIPTAEAYTLFPRIRMILQQDPTLVEQLVYELKKNGLLGALVGELSCHNETFKALAELMANESYGPVVSRKLARAMMQEDVAPPFTGDEGDTVGDAMDGDNGISGDADGMLDDNGDDDDEVGDDETDPTMVSDGDEDEEGADDHDDMGGPDQDMPMAAGSPDVAPDATSMDMRSKPMHPFKPKGAFENLNNAFGRYLKS